MKKIHFNRIWQKFALAVIIVIVIVLAISSYVSYVNEKLYLSKTMEEKLQTTTELAAIAVSDSIWNYNVDGVATIGDALFKDKEVTYVQILDTTLGELYQREVNDNQHEEPYLLTLEEEIIYNDISIGTIRIGLTTFFKTSDIRAKLVSRIVEGVITAIVLFIIITLISTAVTKPLKVLKVEVDAIADGDYGTEIEAITNDEIGELTTKFNYMRASILSAEEESNQLNEELTQLNEELENRVKERTEQLNRTNEYLEESLGLIEETQAELIEKNEELETALDTLHETQEELVQTAKMAMVSQLVAGVAHEINTPLGVAVTLSTYIDKELQTLEESYKEGAMSRKTFESVVKNLRETSDSMLKNIERSAELVGSFKEVAVDQAGEVKRLFNLKEYVDSVLTSLHSKFKRTNYVISVRCPEDIELDSYPGAYSQILTNLLMNTLIHGFENRSEGKIDIDIKIDGEILDFAYSDDGKGISKDQIGKVFEPFYTTKRGEGGSGLGLYIVYNIVNASLGGTIRCSSAVDKGTTFNIKVPINIGEKYEKEIDKYL